MKTKITSKKMLILYGCSGLGVNMLGMIVGSYLCSALLVGGFEDNVENWTYLNKDLVIAALWATLSFISKALDGIIDIPLASFTDNLRTRFGRRRPAILGGLIVTVIAYLLFLVPLNSGATVLNTVWFAVILAIFYSAYTLTMLTYYATFSEVIEKESDRVFISNVKSICDVVYFSLSFALVPVFVGLGMNIRIVALLFLPLCLTMLIPLFMLKENSTKEGTEGLEKRERVSFIKSFAFSFKNPKYIYWLCILFVMNVGLQLFLSGINEFFSTTGINMTFVMASAFAPIPFTLQIYNALVKKFGLKIGYQYSVAIFALGMGLMYFCNGIIPEQYMTIFAICCALIVSFGIGTFFSVTYIIPSQLASDANLAGEPCASSMYFAVQGLFEAISAALASNVLLVFLKQSGGVPYLTCIVAAFCAAAFVLAFFMPKSIATIGKKNKALENK